MLARSDSKLQMTSVKYLGGRRIHGKPTLEDKLAEQRRKIAVAELERSRQRPSTASCQFQKQEPLRSSSQCISPRTPHPPPQQCISPCPPHPPPQLLPSPVRLPPSHTKVDCLKVEQMERNRQVSPKASVQIQQPQSSSSFSQNIPPPSPHPSLNQPHRAQKTPSPPPNINYLNVEKTKQNACNRACKPAIISKDVPNGSVQLSPKHVNWPNTNTCNRACKPVGKPASREVPDMFNMINNGSPVPADPMLLYGQNWMQDTRGKCLSDCVKQGIIQHRTGESRPDEELLRTLAYRRQEELQEELKQVQKFIESNERNAPCRRKQRKTAGH